MYFAISKLLHLVDIWGNWFQMLHGFSDNSGECQHLNSIVPRYFAPQAPKVPM